MAGAFPSKTVEIENAIFNAFSIAYKSVKREGGKGIC